MFDDYAELKAEIESAGFFTTFQPIDGPGDRIVCASRQYTSGPREGGLGGNSFWIAVRDGQWYVGAWGPAIYRLPKSNRLTVLCLELLRGNENRAYFDFEESVQKEFELIPIPDEEFT
jgi:hypothetical protein